MQVSETLNLAADAIERRGWTSGPIQIKKGFGEFDPWGRDGGAVCLEGGIYAAMGSPTLTEDEGVCYVVNYCPAGLAVREYLDLGEFGHLFDYNDEAGRTAEEVIEVLRACAVIEEAKERATQKESVLA